MDFWFEYDNFKKWFLNYHSGKNNFKFTVVEKDICFFKSSFQKTIYDFFFPLRNWNRLLKKRFPPKKKIYIKKSNQSEIVS